MNKDMNKKIKKARCIRDLKVLAWKIEGMQEKIPYYSLEFPKEWYEKLYSWYQKILGRPQVTLPLINLNAALQALPISIIDIKSKVWIGHYDWLTFSKPVDKEIIFEIIKSWFTIQFINHEKVNSEFRQEMIEAFNKFTSDELKIKKQELDLSNYKQMKNGTTDIPGVSYSLLPSYIMAYIATEKVSISLSGKQYFFYMAYNADNKKELISYPVEGSEGKYYSLGISFRLVNLPGVREPILKLIIKVKRWANGKYAETIDRKCRTTVFVKYNDLQDNLYEQGTTLGVEKIKYSYNESRFIWDLKTKEILENAKLVYLPEMQGILEESERYLKEEGNYTLLIAYNKDNRYDHSVKSGITMSEKNSIFNQVNELFSFLAPIEKENLSRITTCRLKGNILGEGKNKELINYLQVANRQFSEINIEILWQRENTPKMIIDWFKSSLKDKESITWLEDEDGNTSFIFEKLSVNFISIYTSDLVAPIEVYKDKVESVKQYISKKEENVLSIVEILSKDEKTYKGGKIRSLLFVEDYMNAIVLISLLTLKRNLLPLK